MIIGSQISLHQAPKEEDEIEGSHMVLKVNQLELVFLHLCFGY